VIVCLKLTADPIETRAEYGWKILTIPTATSVKAMAGTGGEFFSEASVFLQHPAAGLVGNVNSVSGAKTSWIFDTSLSNIAINSSSHRNSFGFVFRSIDYGRIDSRDETGEIIGEYHPLELNLGFNYAHRLTPNLFGGANLILLYQKLESSTSVGFATDYGVIYLTPIEGLNLNLALKHVGLTEKGDVERIKLPIAPEAGLSYIYPVSYLKLYLDVSLIKYSDDKLKLNTGGMVRINDMLDLRMGYLVNSDTQSMTTGLGLQWRRIAFDYAFLPSKNEVENSNSFSITYKF